MSRFRLGTPHDVTVVDLETTGVDPLHDQIIEIGATRMTATGVVSEFTTFVRPTVSLPAEITQLTGITSADLAGAPQSAAAIDAFLRFAEGSLWAAHNAIFDVAFVTRAATQHGRSPRPVGVIDTLTLARCALPRSAAGGYRLGQLVAHFGLATPATHRALDDARATLGLLERLVACGPRVVAGAYTEHPRTTHLAVLT